MPNYAMDPGWTGGWAAFGNSLARSGGNIANMVWEKRMAERRHRELKELSDIDYQRKLEESARNAEAKDAERGMTLAKEQSEILRGEQTLEKKAQLEQTLQRQRDEAAETRARIMAAAGITKAGMTGNKPESVESTIALINAAREKVKNWSDPTRQTVFNDLLNASTLADVERIKTQHYDSLPDKDYSGADKPSFYSLYLAKLEYLRKRPMTTGGGNDGGGDDESDEYLNTQGY